jgi:predicted PurR-regulated permease PerM
MASDTDNSATRHLIIAACLIIVAAGLKLAGDLITPLLISLFFSVLCIPPMQRLKRYGVPDGLAIAIVVLGASLAVVGISMIIGRSLSGFEDKVPKYIQSLDGYLEGSLSWLQGQGIDVQSEDLTKKMSSSAIFEFITNLMAKLSTALSGLLLVVLTMIFMLVEASTFPSKLRWALGHPESDLKSWGDAMEKVQKYVAIKAGVSLVTALLATILTAALGIDFPLLWGLVAFLFNFIPNIGSVIAAGPPVLLALVQYGTGSALLVGVGYFAINMVMGNVVEPRLMGQRLGLSTLVVFLSLVFWNWIWGPVGMVLSVPLTVIVKIILEHSEQFKGVAILLGSETSPPEP